MATTKEADLITAVLIYVNRCLAEADHPALRAMGFGPKEIEAVQRIHLADLDCIETLRVNCLRLTLNRDVFWFAMNRMEQGHASKEMQQALIKEDAPQEMMQALFGMSAKKYTRRRRLMNLGPAVGRPAEPEDENAHALWAAWEALVKGEDRELLTAEEYLALKAATGVALRAIWHLTRRWAMYGNPEGRPPI